MDTNDGALNLYREVFRRMLSVGDTRLIHNDSKNHACALIAELLKSATQEVLIFCNRLGLDVWCDKDVLEGLKYALSNGIKVDVLLQNDPEDPERNSAYKLLCEKPCQIVSKTSSKAVVENFIVVDRRAYRLEQDTQCRKGFACANDPANATILVNAFNDLKSASCPLNIKQS